MCVCVFVILLNGFFLDLMELVPSQGTTLHHTHAAVKRSETAEQLRALVRSICERWDTEEIPSLIVFECFFVYFLLLSVYVFVLL